MNRYHLLILILLLMVLPWARVTPAQAHAELVRSIPEANAHLAHSPTQIDLFFSEAVDSKLSKLNVLDLNGDVVDARDGRVDPADSTHMTATLSTL